MSINSAFSVLQGLGYGFTLTEIRRLENSVSAGKSNSLTAMLQLSQGIELLDIADRANKAARLPLLPWTGKAVVCLTPVLLAILKSQMSVPEKARFALTFFQDHLGTLYQLAVVVSSISLLFFGQTYFAISSLFVLGIGTMDRNGWLPLTLRQYLHQYSGPLLTVTGLVAGGIINQIFAVLNFLSWYANTHLSQNTLRKGFPFKENLTPEQASAFLNKELPVRVNKEFIHCNPLPPIPNIDIQVFIDQFDHIDWELHFPALCGKLKNDARFIAEHRTLERKTPEEISAFARRSLQTFIDTVKERRILEGEPTDYQRLHDYLKIIAKHLQHEPDETTRTDMIFRLAVEGGGYCGPGKFEVAESLYVQTLGNNSEIPFIDKVVCCLQTERNHWMYAFYFEAFTQTAITSRIGQIIDWHDIHNYNLFVNLYGNEFGLQKAAADNDHIAAIDPLIQWIISHTLKEKIQKAFWNDHHPYNHAQTLIGSIGTPQLPKPDVYAFWRKWIERQAVEESVKQAYRDELAKGQLFGRLLEVNGTFSPEFASLMLLDMGILEAI